MTRRTLVTCWAALHLALILTACATDLKALVRRGLTIVPAQPAPEREEARMLGRRTPLRELFSTYLRYAGIEAPYSFFAPNVPDRHQIVFELRYPDGRITYEAPAPQAGEIDVRVSSFMDQIVMIDSKELRNFILRQLTEAAWKKYPESVGIRGMLVRVMTPTLAQWSGGGKGEEQILYTCELARIRLQ